MYPLSVRCWKAWIASRRTCAESVCALHKICGREALLPKSFPIPLCYDAMDTPQTHGGLADVWKGEHRGREVAAEALRVYRTSDFERIRKVGGAPLIVSSNEPVFHTVVLQGGGDVEDASSPECVTTVRRDDVRGSPSVRDGIRVDGEWEHQPVSAACGRKSVKACTTFVRPSPSLGIDDYTIIIA